MIKHDFSGDEIGMIIDQALERLEAKKEKEKSTLLTSTEVAKRLQLSKVTLWRYDCRSYLKVARHGKPNWYLLADVERFERGERIFNEGGHDNE